MHLFPLLIALCMSFIPVPAICNDFSTNPEVALKSPFSFVSSYSQWIDKQNSFIDYFEVDGQEQARVVFAGSSMQDPDSDRPTVSEGMGYGLLLACAYNDQGTFDKFLSYVISVANNDGCSLYYNNACHTPAHFMMPWMVNSAGKTFMYTPPGASTAYNTSSSATDADIQIAWAVYLASQKVQQNAWQNTQFKTSEGTLDYDGIFQKMALGIRLADVDSKALRYSPGNQWDIAGTKVMYPGYFTPNAFAVLEKAPIPDISVDCSSFSIDNALAYKFSGVLTSSFKAITQSQDAHDGLVPNVINYDGISSGNVWYDSFAYDACRFPMWTSYFAQTNPGDPLAADMKISANKLLNKLISYVQKNTLPSLGVDAFDGTAQGDWDSPSIALNAPVMAAAYILGDQDLYNQLSPPVFSYDIAKNQPSKSDAIGDSSHYYTAAMVLISRAILENRLGTMVSCE